MRLHFAGILQNHDDCQNDQPDRGIQPNLLKQTFAAGLIIRHETTSDFRT